MGDHVQRAVDHGGAAIGVFQGGKVRDAVGEGLLEEFLGAAFLPDKNPRAHHGFHDRGRITARDGGDAGHFVHVFQMQNVDNGDAAAEDQQPKGLVAKPGGNAAPVAGATLMRHDERRRRAGVANDGQIIGDNGGIEFGP